MASAASAQTIVQTCPDRPYVRVEWAQSSASGGVTYTLQGLRDVKASTSPQGWLLHHRPPPALAEANFEPDVFVGGPALLGYGVSQALLPNVPWPYQGGRYDVTALTSPDGECVFSPLAGSFRTYDPKRTGPKIAVLGDSLVSQSELCWLFPADVRACGVGLGNRLRQDGQRPWIMHGPGQTFYSWLDVIRERATTRPDRVVLAFGTNDVHWVVNAPQTRRELQRWAVVRSVYSAIHAIQAANPAACTVLVTIAVKDPNEPDVAAETARVNTLLRGVAEDPRLASVVTADFAAAVEARCPGWQIHPAQSCPLLAGDQAHLTSAGDDVRDALIVEATHACDLE